MYHFEIQISKIIPVVMALSPRCCTCWCPYCHPWWRP